MPSPLAHVGAALALVVATAPVAALVPGAAGAAGRSALVRVGLAAALASIAPDFDIGIALIVPDGLDWHRGPSHSVLGAAAIGAACAGLARVRGRGAWFAVVGAAVLHVPFDWSTGEPGAHARYGVPWAWPFSAEKVIDPRPWFGAFKIDEAGFLANMWAPHALPVYLGELATAVGLLLMGALVLTGRRVLHRV